MPSRSPFFRTWFGQARPFVKRTARAKLNLEALENRLVPASFNPSPLVADGDEFSLRDAVIQANTNGSTSNTINLQAGTYWLCEENTSGQENSAFQGDLDLTTFGKTYIFQGQGKNATIIDADRIDRVFQVFPGVKVIFKNLTIREGNAIDNGAAGVGFNTTTAQGGGILNDGGSITLTNVLLEDNSAFAGYASDGPDGQNGGDGRAALGGGIYSSSGKVILNGSTWIHDNVVVGGEGGDGGQNVGPSSSSSVGNGGDGGAAMGGGIYANGGTLSIVGAARIEDNSAFGGEGGDGGEGNGRAGGIGGEGGSAFGGGVYAESLNLNIDTSGDIALNGAYGGFGGEGGSEQSFGGEGGFGGLAHGGGVYVLRGNATIFGTSINQNSAYGGDGGRGGQGATSEQGSFGGEGGFARGGGLYLDQANVNIQLSVIANNTAGGGMGGTGGRGGASGGESLTGGDGGYGGFALGGGIYVNADTVQVRIKTTTLASNQALGGEGGYGGRGGINSNTSNNDLFGGDGGDGGFAGGGGVYLEDGLLAIRRSTVATNAAIGGEGGFGGSGGEGSDEIDKTDLRGGDGGRGNFAGGGGLYVAEDAVLSLISSTVSGNHAQGGAGGDGGPGGTVGDYPYLLIGDPGFGGEGSVGVGGGIYAESDSTLIFYNDTIAFNTASFGWGSIPVPSSNGGGVYANGAASFAVSTIFSNNSGESGNSDFVGEVTASACLFKTDDSAVITQGADKNVIGYDAGLKPLGDYGGPTFTHALSSTSPALGRGSNPLKFKHDQRGAPRNLLGVDIGAYESAARKVRLTPPV